MQIGIVVNRGSRRVLRDGVDARRIEAACRAAGLRGEVREAEGAEILEATRAFVAGGVEAVVAGGGDGTLSAVAGVLAGTGIPMGVLPLGTANHFARDVGVPLDVQAAFALVACAEPRPVDAGAVDGRLFLDNVVLGGYPVVARVRDRLRAGLPLGNRTAKLLAAALVFPALPTVEVTVRVPGEEPLAAETPFLFVGTNPYAMRFPGFGARERRTGGRLALYLAPCRRHLHALRLAWSAVAGDLCDAPGVVCRRVSELEIAGEDPFHVFVDGELATRPAPLRLRALPDALHVFLP